YSTIADYSHKYVTTFTPIGDSLPENIHLLTLEKWSDGEVLVRFEHMYEKDDNHRLSEAVEFDLGNVLKTLNVVKAVEMNLAANELLSETKRLNWKSMSCERNYDNCFDNQFNGQAFNSDLTVRLEPQQIRTFILTVNNTYHKEAKCTYEWRKAYPRDIPVDAYVAGYDESQSPLYVCRHTLNGVFIAGKANKHSGCVVTDAGEEVYIEGVFEVLTARNVQWVPRHGEDPIPDGALLVGTNGAPNTNTYIGRCGTQNATIVGKIDYKFYYGFHGLEKNDCGIY
ncbi:unnamed protein product, partial [Medioppia subpectinata]